MRTNPYITRAILLGTAFAASSCMMGPDFKPVDMPMPAAFRGAPAATESIADLPWWKVFKNKDLQDLLTDTYNNNRDLKATMARVEKARQYITITEAPLFRGRIIPAPSAKAPTIPAAASSRLPEPH